MTVKRKDSKGRVLPDGVSQRNDGRYIYRTQLYGKTHYIYDRDLNKLKEKIIECQYNLKNGSALDVSNLTLDQWYPQFVEMYKVGKVKDGTLNNYYNYYRWYVQGSVIGRMPIKELKRTKVIAHFRELVEKKNLAHGTLRSLASMLYNCLQQAVYDEVISLNPAMQIMKEVNAAPKEEREALTVEETKVLIDFLKIEGAWQNVYLPCVAIGLSTGLRFGELFALTWKDVDFKNKLIHINKGIHYRNRGNGKNEYFITTPKTKKAVRDFPMTDEVERLFKMQRKYQKEMRIRDDIMIDGFRDFVFVAKTGKPYTHEAIVRALKLMVKQANEWECKRAEEEGREPVEVPVHTPHVWRHTATTRMVEKQVPCEVLKVLLGHASIKTTIDVYTHIKSKSLKKMGMDMNGVINLL